MEANHCDCLISICVSKSQESVLFNAWHVSIARVPSQSFPIAQPWASLKDSWSWFETGYWMLRYANGPCFGPVTWTIFPWALENATVAGRSLGVVCLDQAKTQVGTLVGSAPASRLRGSLVGSCDETGETGASKLSNTRNAMWRWFFTWNFDYVDSLFWVVVSHRMGWNMLKPFETYYQDYAWFYHFGMNIQSASYFTILLFTRAPVWTRIISMNGAVSFIPTQKMWSFDIICRWIPLADHLKVKYR